MHPRSTFVFYLIYPKNNASFPAAPSPPDVVQAVLPVEVPLLDETPKAALGARLGPTRERHWSSGLRVK